LFYARREFYRVLAGKDLDEGNDAAKESDE
jgi:hypothetical protein